MSPSSRKTSNPSAACSRRLRRSASRPTRAPHIQPTAAPAGNAQATSTRTERASDTPGASSASASRIPAAARPSFIPPSAVRATRTESRSVTRFIWTSDASTGSVGATIAASSRALAHPTPKSHHAATAASAMVATIAGPARRSGTRHAGSPIGTPRRNPTLKSDSTTPISAIASTSGRWSVRFTSSSPYPPRPST